MLIQISKAQGNSTPSVVHALAQIKANGGGEIHFEKGEYHFYSEGTYRSFFAVSNNSANEKAIVFPIIDMENVTVDGHGSMFVFHEITFPFMISNSKGITVKNAVMDLGVSPLVNFKLHDMTDDGFYMDINKEESPFFIENGTIYFERETGTWDGASQLLSLHAVGRHHVQYLATGLCADRDFHDLPAPLLKCNVSETPNGIYARYREDTLARCTFGAERISSIIDGGRNVDVICLDRSEKIEIANVKVARGIGMGVIGQLSRDILIDGFSTDGAYHPNQQSLTADSLHFVNCDGSLEIKNCTISDTMDDAINVHGMYTSVQGWGDDTLQCTIMHHEQLYFNPYRAGDRLEIIHSKTFEVVAEFMVETAFLNRENGREITLRGHYRYGIEQIEDGFWIENPDRMPNLHLHHNSFSNFPHNRISGSGEILVEENRFSNCHAALLCYDLAKYWYESGRVKHLVYQNNDMKNCNITENGAFIRIGISGVPDEVAPKIHKRIEIIGNRFSDIANLAIKAGGVSELILEDNVFDTERDGLIQIH